MQILPDEVQRKSIALVRNLLMVSVSAMALLQMCLHPDRESILCLLLALAPFLSSCWLIFRNQQGNAGAALTGTLVFFIVAANSAAPILGTLLEEHSITTTLALPVESFTHRAIYGFVLLASYWLAGSALFRIVDNISKLINYKFEVGVVVNTGCLWMLGGVGLAASILKILPIPIVIAKILDGFCFLGWSPFLLLLPPYRTKTKSSGFVFLLIPFYVIIATLSVAGNSRMGLIGPIAAVAEAWFIALLLGLVAVDRRFLMRISLLTTAGLFALSQMVDLSTAIQLERGHRGERGMEAQLRATLRSFMDKESLDAHRAYVREIEDTRTGWSENYIANPFLARFIQTKFDDNCLVRIQDYGDAEFASLKDVSQQKVVAMLPEPFLKHLGLKVDKEYVNAFSTGDLIESLGGNNIVLGSRVTGSIPAHAFALFDWWYPLVLLGGYTLLFAILRGLVVGDPLLFHGASTLAMMSVFHIFTDISLDGVGNPTGFLLRGLWEMLAFYILVIWVIPGRGSLEMPQAKPVVQT